jgi:hypothetical protein
MKHGQLFSMYGIKGFQDVVRKTDAGRVMHGRKFWMG